MMIYVYFNLLYILVFAFFYRKLKQKLSHFRSSLENCRKNSFYEQIGFFIKNNRMGKHSYVGDYFCVSSVDTQIGKFCSIADNVSLGTTFHPTNRLTTHPFTYFDPLKLSEKTKLIPFTYRKPVIVGNDVWIGKHVTVMDGITIGDGAIIGTNAVVTKDVPPYAIVVGVPAKILRYRFDDEIIKNLLQLKWWDFEDGDIEKLPFCDVEECVKILKSLNNMEK